MDLVDEHYYNDPSWFLANTERYDSYDREGPHVFLGEYASRGNTWWNGLTEAAYMTGLERNGDLVELASYAPLLANESYVQWSPDAIWFDNDESWASANYWVQHLFSNNVGDQVVPSTLTTPSVEPQPLDGGVFLSTWATSAAYDNVRVTENDGGDVLFEDTFADASAWSPQTGSWSVVDGEYVQSSTDDDRRPQHPHGRLRAGLEQLHARARRPQDRRGRGLPRRASPRAGRATTSGGTWAAGTTPARRCRRPTAAAPAR